MMKKYSVLPLRLAALTVALFFGTSAWVQAFPPAPPHEIYGMVRGEDGEPLTQSSVALVLETDQGVRVTGSITPNLEPGVNYRLTIPMDSGVTADPYLSNALMPTVPFRIKVMFGSTVYLPIEMAGDFANLGDPGQSTRIDLTLGVDSDGDGLPDAWEQMVISQLAGGLTLADIRPDGDSDHDGLSNFGEYIAGTYAFDPEETFALVLKEQRSDRVVLEFLAIRGRTYEILRSSDLETWEKVSFRVPVVDNQLRATYSASDVRDLQVEVPSSNPAETKYFYQGMVK